MIKKIILFLTTVLLVVTPAMALTADSLVPIGHTTGIKMFSKGVIVVGTTEVLTERDSVSPSDGIKKGDVITKVNGIGIEKSEDFQEVIRKSGGKPVKLTVLHGDREKQFLLTPAKDMEGEYKLGLWVRDSMAGIGTITFYHPQSGTFGALGHGICDSDTGVLIPFRKGSVMESTVDDVKKGVEGEPGELKGNYNLSGDYGILMDNTNSGIFGKVKRGMEFGSEKPIPVAKKSEVKCGPATILSNIEGDNVEEYKIEIVKIYPSGENDTKNMMIKICDKNLIEKTGGIVQGMSGSPILQNGKIVGAVTHVLVNDPCRGYGIFIENMLAAAG
ncbi:MAG: SpoIVB peptidase [Clostridia bacterium]|nr:SpoIVB peptidase [Clostridia bacterium]